jgi:Tol biopolymer transport system component
LTHPGGAAHDFHPAVSPDGKWVAFARWLTNSTSQLYVVPFGGGPERRVTAEHADIKGIAWRDERSLIISSNRKGPHQLWMVPLEGGVPVLVPTTGVSAQEPSLSRDGSTLVYSDLTLESEIWAGPPSGGLRRIVASTRQNHSAQFSPDGSRIAYVSNSSGSWEVWTAGADGAGPRQLTKFGGPLLGTVHWSPDGKSLAFDARPKGYSQIFIMNADGAGLRPVNRNNAEEKMPNFSRDGKWIYFNSNRDGAQRLWKKSLVSGEELRLAENFATDSAESVDGRTVYFLSRGPGIYEVAASGGQARLAPGLADANPRRVWAVDQKGIWYLNPGIGTLMLFSLEARSARAVLPLTRPVADTPSLSVFGDQLVFAREGLSRSDLMIARHLNR